MRFNADQAEPGASFNQVEQEALSAAAEDGWLTLTPRVGDRALTRWQRTCERTGKPFAVVRLEPGRASLWLLLTPDREWTAVEQARILSALADSSGYVVTSNHVRAFVRLGAQHAVMHQLLAAGASLH